MTIPNSIKWLSTKKYISLKCEVMLNLKRSKWLIDRWLVDNRWRSFTKISVFFTFSYDARRALCTFRNFSIFTLIHNLNYCSFPDNIIIKIRVSWLTNKILFLIKLNADQFLFGNGINDLSKTFWTFWRGYSISFQGNFAFSDYRTITKIMIMR